MEIYSRTTVLLQFPSLPQVIRVCSHISYQVFWRYQIVVNNHETNSPHTELGPRRSETWGAAREGDQNVLWPLQRRSWLPKEMQAGN